MDKVPDHIENLRQQMAAEWYNQLPLKEMAESYPDATIVRYFLDISGKPDRTKTTDVLAVPISDYRKGKVIEAAKKVGGLHFTFVPNTLYIGWDRAAVAREVAGHWDKVERERKKEERERKQEMDARDKERKSMHSDYLREAQKAKGKKLWSPVGEYIVDCETIESGWSNDVEDLSLDVCETDNPGVFEAHFDFGIIEGIMILCDQKAMLDQYCAELEKEEDLYGEDEDESTDYDSNEEEKEEEEEDQPAAGSKRKAPAAPRGRGRPPKKAKSSPTQPLKFFFKWKGRETGEGQIIDEAEEGVIQFDNSKYARFTGKTDMEFVDSDVSFTARKVSGRPRSSSKSWSSFSGAAYEHARVARWH